MGETQSVLASETGFKFRVANVDPSSNQPRLYNQEAQQSLYQYYTTERRGGPTPDPKVEVSRLPHAQVARGSLVHAALSAFDGHYGLTIRPDDVWILFCYAFSKHLDYHHEELRSNFVEFEGKKELRVEVDHFRIGKMAPEDWEADVFPDFTKQIKSFIGEKTHALLTKTFSTSTVADKAAFEISLMSSMKHYFTYKMRTLCGIPWIELAGKTEDWKDVRSRAEEASQLMTPEFSKLWMPLLLPVLDQFVSVCEGTVDTKFWQGIAKNVQHGRGSGAYTSVSGWISILYPYLSGKTENFSHLKPWETLVASDGPEPSDFPSVICTAPVVWEYFGTNYPLHFHAGIMGYHFDTDSGSMKLSVGWGVTHDPPEATAEQQ